MIVQTSNYSFNQVSMEVIGDDNRSVVLCYFNLQQLDRFIKTLSQHRANLVAANQPRQTGGSHVQHREAAPAHAGMNPAGNTGWDGCGTPGGGYGGGGCGNGL
ncbi:hypothetical protein Q3C01_28020 [Bradyrhizobium sp. UFLA05-109]